jgi:hypothetical protein
MENVKVQQGLQPFLTIYINEKSKEKPYQEYTS